MSVPLPKTLDDTRLAASHIRPPLVSVIVTSHNYARYIGACLDGVCRQTYAGWECLVVDDASTDDSPAVVEAFIAACPCPQRFRLVRRPRNGGQMEAFRDGLALARGEFVMMLDADDVLLPTFLAAHLDVHLGKKHVAFTSSNQYHINGQGEVIAGDHPDHLGRGRFRYVPQQCFHKGFWLWATASSMLLRRAAVELVMPDPGVTFPICADYYIAHFCQQIGNSILIPDIHGCYRRHGDNGFSANPSVGSVNAMGDFSRHPPHDVFRQAMIEHILAHQDRFLPIFGANGLLVLLFRLSGRDDLRRILRQDRLCFHPAPGPTLRCYDRFRLSRWRYDRCPLERRLMVLSDPITRPVPAPPTPGRILLGRLSRRLGRLVFGSPEEEA